MSVRSVLFLCTGYRYRKTGNVNVGDNAQQEHGLELIRQQFPGAAIVQMANSLNEETTFTGTCFSHKIVSYVIGDASGILPRRAMSLARALLLVLNAWLRRVQFPHIGLSRAGRDALDEIASSDFIFCAGSGNFHDGYMLSVGFLWSCVIFSGRLLGLPVIMLGQQVGSLNKPLSRVIAGVALRRVSFLGVREAKSQAVASALGVAADRLHLTGDEGWYLPPASATAVDVAMAGEGIPEDFIAVQMRFDHNSPFAESVAAFARVCDGLARQLGRPVVFVPFSYSAGYDDRQTSAAVGALMSMPWRLLDIGPDARLTKGILSRASLAVGVANHFCVFAASVGVPTVAIHGTPYMAHKLRGLAELQPHVQALDSEVLGDTEALLQIIINHARKWPRGRTGIQVDRKPECYFDWVAVARGQLPPARA